MAFKRQSNNDMNKIEYLFKIDENIEKSLFETSLIFFDTSALLDFYYFSEENRTEVEEKLFKPLAERLWITAQSEYEFLKNREKVISKPTETYTNLFTKGKSQKDGGHIEEIEKLLFQLKPIVSKEIRGHFKTLQERTSKNNKHPYLDGFSFSAINAATHELEQTIDQYEKTFQQFKDDLLDAVELQKNKLKSLGTQDSILETFEKYFNVTKKFSYDEIINIIQEGVFRYDNEIPPGYLDEEEKVGFQKYGDLILWKQLLIEAKKLNKNVILVINDMKEDWWFIDDKKIPLAPRHELITEFNDYTGNKIWLYDINDFLFKSNKYIATTIDNQTIEDIKDVVTSLSINKASNVIDWMIEYFPDLNKIEHFGGYDNYDHKMFDDSNNFYELTHKKIISKVYTKLLIPVKKFLDLQYSRRNNELYKEAVLVLEYPNYELASTFFKHITDKKTLRSLIKNFKDRNRLIVIIQEGEDFKTLYDSMVI